MYTGLAPREFGPPYDTRVTDWSTATDAPTHQYSTCIRTVGGRGTSD